MVSTLCDVIQLRKLIKSFSVVGKKRYKNGKRIPDNHVKYFEYPIAKIETIDPDDEGLYQCFARNDFGEASATFYLHVRPSTLLNHAPLNAKCVPMDKGIIQVTYDKEMPSNKIQYFIASDSPRDFYSHVSVDAIQDGFKIDTRAGSIFKPFKPFYLYMRNLLPNGSLKMILSQLSKPIRCATQGIEPKFVKPPTGIFLRWDTPATDINVTGYTIQFQKNETSTPVSFKEEVIGTFDDFPPYISWEDIRDNLQKIPAKNNNQTDWTEVVVPGNVTGLYIPNTDEINVRILGTVLESGELFNQDIQYLSWTNIKASTFSLAPLRLGLVDSHGAEILWSGLEAVNCASACAIMKGPIINRGESSTRCDKM